MKLNKKICMYCNEKILDNNVFICEKCYNKKEETNWSDIKALLMVAGLLSGEVEFEKLTEEELEQLTLRNNNK